MTFPTPHVSVGATSGQWEIYSDTTTSTYPSGLQYGDVAFMIQANSTGSEGAYPTISTPTSSTQYTNATTTWTSTTKDGTVIYSRALTAVSVRFVTSTQSETSIGAFSTVRCIILRCNAFSGGNFTWNTMISQEGSSTTYSQTVSYAISSVPTASIFATSAVNSAGTVSAFTHTYDSIAPVNTFLVSDAGTTSRSRLSFNFQNTYPASNIVVDCSTTNGSASIHSPSYLGEF